MTFIAFTNSSILILKICIRTLCLLRIRLMWKKICFRSSGLEKTHPGHRKIIFLSKITILLFLKIALFICILQFLSFIDIFFYFTPYKFQCNSTDFHTLHHSQTHFVMKTTYDIKISQILLFKIVEFTHLSFFLKLPHCLITNF